MNILNHEGAVFFDDLELLHDYGLPDIPIGDYMRFLQAELIPTERVAETDK